MAISLVLWLVLMVLTMGLLHDLIRTSNVPILENSCSLRGWYFGNPENAMLGETLPVLQPRGLGRWQRCQGNPFSFVIRVRSPSQHARPTRTISPMAFPVAYIPTFWNWRTLSDVTNISSHIVVSGLAILPSSEGMLILAAVCLHMSCMLRYKVDSDGGLVGSEGVGNYS